MIETGSARDARCIAAALARFDSDAAQTGSGWAVTVSKPDLRLVSVLGSLDQCLTDSGIASVTVTFGDRTYVMEADARSGAARAAGCASVAVEAHTLKRGRRQLEPTLSSV